MFTDARLPTQLWVEALIRRADLGGAFTCILHKGDGLRGDVALKVRNMKDTAHLFIPRTDMDGQRVFVALTESQIAPEDDAVDAYLARARQRDSDLWVIEIEDSQLRHFLTEPVLR